VIFNVKYWLSEIKKNLAWPWSKTLESKATRNKPASKIDMEALR
jgi:hypothetical protein